MDNNFSRLEAIIAVMLAAIAAAWLAAFAALWFCSPLVMERADLGAL